MWRAEVFLLIVHLFLQSALPGCSSNEPEEGRRWIERACAELRVSLEANEVRVVYGSDSRVSQTQRIMSCHSPFSSSTCIRSPFSSRPANVMPLSVSLSMYVGFTS